MRRPNRFTTLIAYQSILKFFGWLIIFIGLVAVIVAIVVGANDPSLPMGIGLLPSVLIAVIAGAFAFLYFALSELVELFRSQETNTHMMVEQLDLMYNELIHIRRMFETIGHTSTRGESKSEDTTIEHLAADQPNAPDGSAPAADEGGVADGTRESVTELTARFWKETDVAEMRRIANELSDRGMPDFQKYLRDE